ncbi:hypothetical protein SAMN04487926_15621 [Paraburkholderia steynii]|uniref:Lipoprotein n=1 Tax=Paraburkholderia steynii TaxID=1245441 RepID=A0A7Z7BL42_9BURK|nr:hypothetical protein [Paraburkholderia steynii]SDJ50347.1 hypothetical protein SAMN04487926_15621 [Paraburkholderia steynii]
MNILSICAIVLSLMPLQAVASGQACDRQSVHAERVQMIGRDMLVNGVPTSVYGMEFDGTPDDVSDAFRTYWTRAHVPATGRRDASGTLLAALDGMCHYVLVIPPRVEGSRTKGLMSVMRLDGADAAHRIGASTVPLPQGARAVSDVESRDGRQTGRTWLLEVNGDTKDNAQRYARRLQEAGWRIVAQAPALRLDGSQRAMGDVLAMQRGSERVDAVFSNHNGRTEAVIHATTGP